MRTSSSSALQEVVARLDQHGVAAVANEDIERTTLLVVAERRGLFERFVDHLAEVVVNAGDGRSVLGLQDRHREATELDLFARLEQFELVLLHVSAAADVEGRGRPVQFRAGFLGDVGHVECMVVVRVRDEECLEVRDSRALECGIHHLGIGLDLAADDLQERRAGEKPIRHQLRLAVIEEERAGPQKGDLHGTILRFSLVRGQEVLAIALDVAGLDRRFLRSLGGDGRCRQQAKEEGERAVRIASCSDTPCFQSRARFSHAPHGAVPTELSGAERAPGGAARTEKYTLAPMASAPTSQQPKEYVPLISSR